jgi:hypothetical protein
MGGGIHITQIACKPRLNAGPQNLDSHVTFTVTVADARAVLRSW